MKLELHDNGPVSYWVGYAMGVKTTTDPETEISVQFEGIVDGQWVFTLFDDEEGLPIEGDQFSIREEDIDTLVVY